LNENYSFEIEIHECHKKRFVIPKGMTYDGASVPQLFMALIGFERDGVHRAAALVHDYLYRESGFIFDNQNRVFRYTRKDADRIFLMGMQFHGIKSWHGRVAYLAVRGFGWLYSRF
jgi:hypothetical protein